MPTQLFLAITTNEILIGVVAFVVGVVIGWFAVRAISGGTIRLAKRDAQQIMEKAESESESLKQKIELDAEREARKRRKELESEVAEANAEIKKDTARIAKREDSLDQMLDKLNERSDKLDSIRQDIDKQHEEIEQERDSLSGVRVELTRRLESVSGMSAENAKAVILEEVRHDAEHDANELVQEIIEKATEEAKSRSREITLQAIQRFASDHVSETTVRAVRLPSDDMKGRIIGREGRNIRALEQATGADILIDDTPGIISVSCFDPIRRAVASKALEKLVADGRVHPSRIEEVVENIRTEINDQILKSGNDAATSLHRGSVPLPNHR